MWASRSAGVAPGPQERPVGPVIREAVSTFRGADDRAAGPDDLGGGRHALDRLVEVLVEGVAAVRRHDDVEWTVDRLHGLAPRLLAGRGVHGQDLAAERPGDPLLVVEQHVQGEIDPGRRRNRPYGVMDRIALDDAPCGPWIADPPRVVELERGREAGQPRGDHLGTTAEAREEMWLDEAGRDPQVRRHPFPVEEDGNVSDHPHVDLPTVIASVVVLDPPPGQHVIPQHRPTLGVGRPRRVPVAMRTTTSSGRMIPSSASMIARSMSGRGSDG